MNPWSDFQIISLAFTTWWDNNFAHVLTLSTKVKVTYLVKVQILTLIIYFEFLIRFSNNLTYILVQLDETNNLEHDFDPFNKGHCHAWSQKSNFNLGYILWTPGQFLKSFHTLLQLETTTLHIVWTFQQRSMLQEGSKVKLWPCISNMVWFTHLLISSITSPVVNISHNLTNSNSLSGTLQPNVGYCMPCSCLAHVLIEKLFQT